MLLEIPAILFGLVLFFLCGVLVGLLVQRLLRGSTGAWRVALIVCVAVATPLAVLFSLVGGIARSPCRTDLYADSLSAPCRGSGTDP